MTTVPLVVLDFMDCACLNAFQYMNMTESSSGKAMSTVCNKLNQFDTHNRQALIRRKENEEGCLIERLERKQEVFIARMCQATNNLDGK